MHVVPLLSFFRVDERERRCICDIGIWDWDWVGAVDGWRPRPRPRPIDMVFFDRRPSVRPSVLEAKINGTTS